MSLCLPLATAGRINLSASSNTLVTTVFYPETHSQASLLDEDNTCTPPSAVVSLELLLTKLRVVGKLLGDAHSLIWPNFIRNFASFAAMHLTRGSVQAYWQIRVNVARLEAASLPFRRWLESIREQDKCLGPPYVRSRPRPCKRKRQTHASINWLYSCGFITIIPNTRDFRDLTSPRIERDEPNRLCGECSHTSPVRTSYSKVC